MSFKKTPFGFIAMLSQFAINGFGLPDQIWTLHEAKTAVGHTLNLQFLYLAASVFFFIHGKWEVANPAVAWPQMPAIGLGLVIIGQIIYYNYF